ncbi:MAG: phosphotransferase family protein [Burkholderiaceae bacterium]
MSQLVQPIDTAKLGQWLGRHVPEISGEPTLTPFSGGQSNPTYRLDAGGRSYVLRSKPAPASQLLPSAHAIEREYRVMAALHTTGFAVPRMLAQCEDESIIGRAFYVMQHMQGRVLWDQSLPDMTPAQRHAHYMAMNQALADLHRCDVGAAGLTDFGRAGQYVERQIARWSKQYVASQTQSIPAMDRLMAWLPAHVPHSATQQQQASVVHGDYRLDNVMFAPDRAQVIAVLDWELSTLGHPLADFSYHCLAWHIEPGAFRGIGGLDWAGLGIPTEDEYIQAYCLRTESTDATALQNDWNFYLAFNFFRLAAILQGIAKRIEDGTAASDQAMASAAGAVPMAQLGWHFAQKHEGKTGATA